jgi:hypothetical protein
MADRRDPRLDRARGLCRSWFQDGGRALLGAAARGDGVEVCSRACRLGCHAKVAKRRSFGRVATDIWTTWGERVMVLCASVP